MLEIKNFVGVGYKTTKEIDGFYPKPKEEKALEFDVKVAKHSQQASQITAFIGILECIKRLITISEDLFSDLLGELNSISERIDLCHQSTTWCEKEMDTLIQANKSGYAFQTNFKKEEKLKYDTEHGLFTPESMPHGFSEQIEKCEELPMLNLLDNDPLNEEGQMVDIRSYKQNYSDPFGIYLKWIVSQKKRTNRKVEKKKDAHAKRKKKKSRQEQGLQKNVTKVDLKREKFKFVGQKKGALGATKGNKSGKSGGMSKSMKTQKVGRGKKASFSEDFGDDVPPPPDLDDEDEDDSDEEFAPPPAPDAPDLGELNLNFGGSKMKRTGEQKEVGDIFAQIRAGGFNLKKVDPTESQKEKPVSERDNLLFSIRKFDKTHLADSTKRVLAEKSEENTTKRAPMNVGQILQQQLAFIAQVGAEDDDDDDDGGWDDDTDDDEW